MSQRAIKFRIWNPDKKMMSRSFTLKEFAFDQDGEQGACNFNLQRYVKN